MKRTMLGVGLVACLTGFGSEALAFGGGSGTCVVTENFSSIGASMGSRVRNENSGGFVLTTSVDAYTIGGPPISLTLEHPANATFRGILVTAVFSGTTTPVGTMQNAAVGYRVNLNCPGGAVTHANNAPGLSTTFDWLPPDFDAGEVAFIAYVYGDDTQFYRLVESDASAPVLAAALVDAGPVDAGPFDAGVVDAGEFDAGVVDAGPSDAGVIDAGPFDAGVFDAGPFDAGEFDAGEFDAGIDAGPVDAGEFDAGPFDAGVVDAGEFDAGPFDAGEIDDDAGVAFDAGEIEDDAGGIEPEDDAGVEIDAGEPEDDAGVPEPEDAGEVEPEGDAGSGEPEGDAGPGDIPMGCTCDSSSSPANGFFLALALLSLRLVRRRRQR